MLTITKLQRSAKRTLEEDASYRRELAAFYKKHPEADPLDDRYDLSAEEHLFGQIPKGPSETSVHNAKRILEIFTKVLPLVTPEDAAVLLSCRNITGTGGYASWPMGRPARYSELSALKYRLGVSWSELEWIGYDDLVTFIGLPLLTAADQVCFLRRISGLSQAAFSSKYEIPKRTLEDWEAGRRTPPAYVLRLLAEAVKGVLYSE